MAEKKKLNDGLDVGKLWICVPVGCHLVSGGQEGRSTETGGEDKDPKAPDCYSADGKPGHKLTGEAAIRHACTVHDLIQRQVLRFPYVTAFDVGFAVKEDEKRFEQTLALRIHVSKKLSDYHLREAGLPNLNSPCYVAPPKQKNANRNESVAAGCCGNLPECRDRDGYSDGAYDYYPISGIMPADLSWCHGRLCICGVPLDVIDAKYFPSMRSYAATGRSGVFVEPLQTSDELGDEEQLLTGRGRVNTLVGGISVGSVTGQAGTLGAVVWDRIDGTPCLLSNWHVLAGSTAAMVGQPCYQPALFDGGTEEDIVGYLKRWHLGELGDAAIAELSCDRHYATGEAMGLWRPIGGYQAPELNLEVRKWGRTTGITHGFIDGIHLATNIDYGNGAVRHFKQQFHIAPLFSGKDVSQVGDSGSVVVACAKPKEMRDSLRRLKRPLFALLHDEVKIEEMKEIAEQVCKEDLKDDEAKVRRFMELFDQAHPTVETRVRTSIKIGETEVKELKRFLVEELATAGIDLSSLSYDEAYHESKKQQRVYHAVGMIFAGDTPGSPFGEFALASPLGKLAEELKFSLRPVFEPRSSFRRLRTESGGRRSGVGGGARGGLAPGKQGADPRDGGPQPDPESAQTGSGNATGGSG